ncbi:hypothetical protein HDU91_001912 [Kappamyces sp. JEL0680]|nr:hypothetical protein HDU91_001912 [Kappamyces sp. JEL0680]
MGVTLTAVSATIPMSFANQPSDLTTESLLLAASLNPSGESLQKLVFSPRHSCLFLAQPDEPHTQSLEIKLLSGGGSGHEPSHASWIAKGMIDASVSGKVFASPNSSQVLACLKGMTSGRPQSAVLCIVKNYTGDRLQFGLALERAKALWGLQCDMLIVQDDCAIPPALVSPATGRRGLAGTVLVHKILGARKAYGESTTLHGLKAFGEALLKDLGTIGVSLSKCHVPGSGPRSGDFYFRDHMEIGLGIHGEPGFEKIPITGSRDLAELILSRFHASPYLVSLQDKTRPVSVLINNLGACTGLEITCFTRDVLLSLTKHGHVVERVTYGTFMTALDMHGLSVTLLVGAEWIPWLDAPTLSRTWVPMVKPDLAALHPSVDPLPLDALDRLSQEPMVDRGTSPPNSVLFHVLTAVCKMLVDRQAEFNKLDAMVGDGDTGTTFAGPAQSLLAHLSAMEPSSRTTTRLLATLVDTVETDMQGSVGVFTLLLLQRLHACPDPLDPSELTNALMEGVASISKYGGATVGNRTLLDALVPGIEALRSCLSSDFWGQGIRLARDSASAGAAATKSMKSAAGRSSYLDQSSVIGHVDAGAAVVASIFETIAKARE